MELGSVKKVTTIYSKKNPEVPTPVLVLETMGDRKIVVMVSDDFATRTRSTIRCGKRVDVLYELPNKSRGMVEGILVFDPVDIAFTREPGVA